MPIPTALTFPSLSTETTPVLLLDHTVLLISALLGLIL